MVLTLSLFLPLAICLFYLAVRFNQLDKKLENFNKKLNKNEKLWATQIVYNEQNEEKVKKIIADLTNLVLIQANKYLKVKKKVVEKKKTTKTKKKVTKKKTRKKKNG